MQIKEKEPEEMKKEVDWGVNVNTLPQVSWEDITLRNKEGEVLIVVHGIVHDVKEFATRHPWGKRIIDFWQGRDATQVFEGLVYKHSKAARNLAAHLRVGLLQETLL